MKNCTEPNCSDTLLAKGLCLKHYTRMRRHGTTKELTLKEKFWSKVKVTANLEKCWIWQGSLNDRGYGNFQLNNKRHKAHRVAWFLVYGKLPDLDLCHTCDNPSCVNPTHLFEGTHAENMLDRNKKERQVRGEKQHLAKLTSPLVLEIKELIKQKFDYNTIAEKYGVSSNAIYNIDKGNTWKHVVQGAK